MSGNLPQDLLRCLQEIIPGQSILEGIPELEKQNNKKGKYLDLVYKTEENGQIVNGRKISSFILLFGIVYIVGNCLLALSIIVYLAES